MQQKILVVDDVTKNIQLLGSILGKEGYSVSYATEGDKAIDMCAREEFDIILLDIMMPGLSGLEVCGKLKNESRTADIPIIFLTAKSEYGDIVKGLQMGAADYLTKPFNSAELLARVQTHLHLRQAQRELKEANILLQRKNIELAALVEEKEAALAEVKQLKTILPICSNCKKIRDDQGYWNQLESYFQAHSEVDFSHGICPDCVEELYPFMAKKRKTEE